MPAWMCPNCGGGFPKPNSYHQPGGNQKGECPWCGYNLYRDLPSSMRAKRTPTEHQISSD